jgi:hypothetical protein
VAAVCRASCTRTRGYRPLAAGHSIHLSQHERGRSPGAWTCPSSPCTARGSTLGSRAARWWPSASIRQAPPNPSERTPPTSRRRVTGGAIRAATPPHNFGRHHIGPAATAQLDRELGRISDGLNCERACLLIRGLPRGQRPVPRHQGAHDAGGDPRPRRPGYLRAG